MHPAFLCDTVSTHAPARGQSNSASSMSKELWKFQLMPPRGGNRFLFLHHSNFNCFNSCPREGAILLNVDFLTSIFSFQLMPPRGGNLYAENLSYPSNLFQLMPPRGGNLHGISLLYGDKNVSTHAPARGQSTRKHFGGEANDCFNSCPREGAIRKTEDRASPR